MALSKEQALKELAQAVLECYRAGCKKADVVALAGQSRESIRALTRYPWPTNESKTKGA